MPYSLPHKIYCVFLYIRKDSTARIEIPQVISHREIP